MNKIGLYRTRRGDIAKVKRNDAPGYFPLVGEVDGQVKSWTPTGTISFQPQMPDDLVHYIGEEKEWE